jgi:hypothetical protein
MLVASAGLAATPSPSFALSVQEALLHTVPAVALVSAEVKASATVNCGQGPITVSPKPFIEAGTGWFVDGRGYLITNADGTVSLKCNENGRYVTVRADGSLIADSATVGSAQKFTPH